LSETARFEAELQKLRASQSSWVELALALRRAKQLLAADLRNDQSAIFESWATRKLGLSEGLLRRYSVVVDFLIRSNVLPNTARTVDVPPGLLRSFSVLELAARIDKLSERDGGEALSQVLAGEATVRSLTERLRTVSSTHVETSTVRRSRSAASRPDRNRLVEQILRSAVETIYGLGAHLRRAINYPAFVRCHFVVDLQNRKIVAFTIINCQSKAIRYVRDAVGIALFSASKFDQSYVVLVEGEEFLAEVDGMIKYFGKASVGLIDIRSDGFTLHRKAE
jgi:hypothetical protein